MKMTDNNFFLPLLVFAKAKYNDLATYKALVNVLDLPGHFREVIYSQHQNSEYLDDGDDVLKNQYMALLSQMLGQFINQIFLRVYCYGRYVDSKKMGKDDLMKMAEDFVKSELEKLTPEESVLLFNITSSIRFHFDDIHQEYCNTSVLEVGESFAETGSMVRSSPLRKKKSRSNLNDKMEEVSTSVYANLRDFFALVQTNIDHSGIVGADVMEPLKAKALNMATVQVVSNTMFDEIKKTRTIDLEHKIKHHFLSFVIGNSELEEGASNILGLLCDKVAARDRIAIQLVDALALTGKHLLQWINRDFISQMRRLLASEGLKKLLEDHLMNFYSADRYDDISSYVMRLMSSIRKVLSLIPDTMGDLSKGGSQPSDVSDEDLAQILVDNVRVDACRGLTALERRGEAPSAVASHASRPMNPLKPVLPAGNSKGPWVNRNGRFDSMRIGWKRMPLRWKVAAAMMMAMGVAAIVAASVCAPPLGVMIALYAVGATLSASAAALLMQKTYDESPVRMSNQMGRCLSLFGEGNDDTLCRDVMASSGTLNGQLKLNDPTLTDPEAIRLVSSGGAIRADLSGDSVSPKAGGASLFSQKVPSANAPQGGASHVLDTAA
jgi:hypothetical protein